MKIKFSAIATKKYLLLILVINFFLSYANLTYAQATTYNYQSSGVQKSIESYLCAPPEGNTGTYGQLTTDQTTAAQNNPSPNALYTCINKLYRFAIIIASVMGVFFIVIAGYIYMGSEGNQESVDKAKSIINSTITSLVILFIGYILLKALNPDLVQFQNIQPPSVIYTTSTPPGGGGGGGITIGGGPNYYVINTDNGNYNIGPYATAANHEVVVQQTYNSLKTKDLSTPQKITQYIQSRAMNGATAPVTGDMVINAANGSNVDVRLLMALMEVDSHYGTDGSRAINNHNPGNVGNTDAGNNQYFNTWQDGVNAVAAWLNRNRA